MPRRARLRLAHVPFHIVQRGHNRNACFLADRDRLRYLGELAVLSRSHSVAVHAYVLMTNHVHLLATASDADGIPEVMTLLGMRYARYFNDTHERTGSIWEGRYHSSVIESERYLLTCHRYIEENPVRAGMVSSPGDYRWSSFRANAFGEPDSILSPHPVIAGLGRTPNECQAAYRELFDVAVSPESLDEIRLATRGGYALGGDPFKKELETRLRRRVTRLHPGRPKKSDCVPVS